MSRKVFINATSLHSGGALTILNNFILDLVKKPLSDSTVYYLFVPDNCEMISKNKNLVYIVNGKNKQYKNKYYWNLMGMKKWSVNEKIYPNEIYSLQNYFPLGFSNKKIFKRLYLHTVIPFINEKWNLLNKDERILWIYKNVYSYPIKRSVKISDSLIVQTEWFKNLICNELKINEKKVAVIKPQIFIENIIENPAKVENNNLNLFYPASDLIYKNHEILYKMMHILINTYKIKNIKLHLTISKENKRAVFYSKKYKLEQNIVLIGNLSYTDTIDYYKKMDVLVFPSKLESLGLPLIEAQRFNLPIISNNSELFKEVIGDYSKDVIYCASDNEYQWADAVYKIYIE